MAKNDQTAPAVRTRRVHYFAGLDPRGARFYHRLYAEEGRKQAAVIGHSLEIGPLESSENHVPRWKVSSYRQGSPVETDYQFMDWEDLMRENWGKLISPGKLILYLKYVLLGDAWRVARASRYFFYTTLAPFLYALLLALTILLSTGFTYWGVKKIGGTQVFAATLSSLVVPALLYCGWRYARKTRILWLLRVCTCVLSWSKNRSQKSEARMAQFADHILREQEREPVDEVLIVGHSIGAILGIQVAARILGKQPAAVAARMHLMTIGSSIPFLGVLPRANWFRQDLEAVANDARLPWTDFTAIKDILCFFKVNPVEASGVVAKNKNRPRSFPVRIYRMFSKERYAEILRDHLRVHLQYLMASDLAVDYDYFSITAGPRTLCTYKSDKAKSRA